MTGDREEAKEIRQMALIQILQRAGSFQNRSRFSTWLYRIASNTSLDVRASSKRKQVHSLDALLDGPMGVAQEPRDAKAESPIGRASQRELQESIQDALTRLSPKYRQVIVLRYLEGKRYPEIAEVLQISLGTVKSRMARAHVALGREIAPLLERFVA
jgi:RNA polymerase sigma-70 factor (ECF subfamily)